jgi:5,10-methylenetetrahydromethanopterin reductase
MAEGTFGVELFEYPAAGTVVAEAREAERLGYAAVWLGDAQLLWRELYVLLGAVAASTTRVALGSSVTNAVTRHASVTAGAAVTLQELTGGRFRLGIGAGNTSTGMLGQPSSTRAALREYVATVRALCAGETVASPTGDLRLVFGGPGQRAPVLIGGSGPRLLRLAGEIGDGAIVGGGPCSLERLRAKLAAVQAGRVAAGRATAPFRVCLSAAAAVHPDRDAAIAAVRPAVAATLVGTDPHWPLSDAARRAQPAVREVYAYGEHMHPSAGAKLAAVLPDEVVLEFALAGTPADCLARAEAFFTAGVDEIILNPYGVAGAPRTATLEALARAW